MIDHNSIPVGREVPVYSKCPECGKPLLTGRDENWNYDEYIRCQDKHMFGWIDRQDNGDIIVRGMIDGEPFEYLYPVV